MVIEKFKTEFDEANRMRKLSGLSLMTEEYYYKEVLNEDDRYDWLYNNYKDKFLKKYKSKYDVDYVFDKSDDEIIKLITPNLSELIKGDPTSNVKNEQIIKTGKYSQWIIKQYLQNETGRFFEDLYKITNDLKIYDKIKHKLPEDKRDINQIKTSLELYNIVKPYAAQDLRLKSEKKGDITTLYNDNDYHVLIPKTKESACSYGQGTRWCTASHGLNYFESYTSRGPLYIIIHKTELVRNQSISGDNEKQDRYQFHFEDNQFMDVDDSPISLEQYFNTNPIVFNVFKNLFVKEKNIKNLVTIGEYKIAFEISKGDLSKFDAKSTLKLYKEKLIDDKSMNKKWNKKDEIFENGSLYYISDDGWCDESLSNLFHKDYQEFAKKLLCGDGYEFFHYSYDIDLNNNWDDINKENLKEIQKLSIGKITDEGIKITKTNIKKYNTDIKSDNGLYELVNSNEDWEDIKTAIEHSAQDRQRNADEGTYWKAYTDLIVDKLGPYKYKNNKYYFRIIGYSEWVSSYQEFYPDEDPYNFSIMDIIKTVLDEGNDLIRPREDYYGDWDEKYFNEILSDKLLEVE